MRYIRYIKSQFNILSEVFSGAITHGLNAISINAIFWRLPLRVPSILLI